MERRAERSSGFAATLRAAAGFEAPETVLPLLDLALRESGAVRKEALRHLLSLRGSSAAEIVVRGFSLLDATERVEAMRDRERLLGAALSVLASPVPGGRAGVAAFASSLAPGEGWDLLLCLLDDPDQEARTAARRALVGFSREYASGRRSFPATGKIRPYLQALLRALQSSHPGDLEALTAALVHAGGHSSEARAALRSVIADEGHPARESVLEALRGGDDAAAARVLLTLLSSGSRSLRDLAISIISQRREPAFLLALARAASLEMESHGGISAAALARLEHAAWDSLRSEDVLSLPASARACLLSILRKLRGRTRARPDRSARVSEYVFPTAAPYLPAGAARTP